MTFCLNILSYWTGSRFFSTLDVPVLQSIFFVFVDLKGAYEGWGAAQLIARGYKLKVAAEALTAQPC